MIFLVDDNDELRTALEELVRTLGYDVCAFPAAEQALAGLGADSRTVDLLITDIRLPRMDGLELVEQFRLARPALPVIVISSLSGDMIQERGLCGGHTCFLRKPIRMAQLSAAIRSATSACSRPATIQSPDC